MSTILFDRVIFGPVHSRRLGLSLGVNLLPTDNKLCNFDCIYCECGWGKHGFKPRFNTREEVRTLLRAKLREMAAAGTPPDVITFAGNGEPTMHPQFEEIISDTIAVRDELCPSAKVSVLSNATMIGRDNVRRALLKVDNNILKLDSALDETVRLIDQPRGRAGVAETVRLMKLFGGRLIVQTMFLRGMYDGQHHRSGGVHLAGADPRGGPAAGDDLHDRPRDPGARTGEDSARRADEDRGAGRGAGHSLFGFGSDGPSLDTRQQTESGRVTGQRSGTARRTPAGPPTSRKYPAKVPAEAGQTTSGQEVRLQEAPARGRQAPGTTRGRKRQGGTCRGQRPKVREKAGRGKMQGTPTARNKKRYNEPDELNRTN